MMHHLSQNASIHGNVVAGELLSTSQLVNRQDER